MTLQHMKQVESSNIMAIGYEPTQKVMRVEFKGSGAIYDYANVDKDTHDSIMNATSVGSTFNKLVKSKPSLFPYTQVQ